MNTLMKKLTRIAGIAVACGILGASLATFAADTQTPDTAKKAKPYPLKTCLVSGEKLDGDMGKPYVFVHEGQEFKLCCKGCLKDFNKEPAKFVKQLAEEQKKAAKH
jgi:hypothetical protein